MLDNSTIPIFPINHSQNENSFMAGLNKREFFAIMALHGTLSNSITGGHRIPEIAAKEAVQYADELLRKLKVENDQSN